MKLFDSVFLISLSDLLINLSAGYLGAAFIAPNFSKKKIKEKIIFLTLDLILAILIFALAVFIKHKV